MREDKKALKRILDNERIVTQLEMLYNQFKQIRGCGECIDDKECRKYGLEYNSIIASFMKAYSDVKELEK